MATLTEAAYYGRKFIKYGSIVLILYIVIRLGFFLFTRWWEETHPVKPPPPKCEFGKLPQLPFPIQVKPSLGFQLETISGTTEEFDDQAKVYLMPVKRSNLLALERATEMARKMGFLFDPSQISETQYIWTKEEPIPSTLQVDIVTGHFTLNAEWGVRPDLLVGLVAPSPQEAINQTRSWLSALDLLPDDMSIGDAQVDYFKIAGTEIVPALSQSEAQFVKVSLSRDPVDELVVWPTNSEESSISVMFIPSAGRLIIVIQSEYRYLPVEYEQSGSYPIIASQTAWDNLLAGAGFYANYSQELSDVKIRRISLGYYDPPVSGFFLQPIFVFEGDGNFLGFVPAVDIQCQQQESNS
jgi:hypothetical protein